jgi:hypothetical protein
MFHLPSFDGYEKKKTGMVHAHPAPGRGTYVMEESHSGGMLQVM